MLEGLATWFLNNYLGKYLENLNADQLSIALLQGEVELENVPLRRDALRFVDTAVDVRSGLVGRIKLKIPVSRVRSEPWSIVMEKVYIVVGPQRFEDYDEVKEDDLALEIKFAALEGIESEWRAIHDVQKSGSYYPSYSSWMAYGTSFIGTIIENLQVQIRDVHIRYEDDVTFPSRPFAAGFSIESLTAHSCDQNWTPKFVYRDQGETMAYKVVELQNMAAYLNTDVELFGGLTITDLKEKMAIFPGKYSTNEFILSPVSASATIKRNCSETPLNSRKTPRVIGDLQLNSIPLEISDRQYQCALSGARSIHQLNKNRKYWRWKPLYRVRGNARAWWQYAITCYLEEIRRKANNKKLSVILHKCRENVEYVSAFKLYLDNPMALDIKSKDCKNTQDVSRSYDELKTLRELAAYYLTVERNKEITNVQDMQPATTSFDSTDNIDNSSPVDSKPAESLLQRWFPLWGGWYANTVDDSAMNENDKLLENQQSNDDNNENPNRTSLEGEIMDALADEANVVPYKDVVFAQLGFSLKRGTVQLYSKKSFNDRTSSRRLLFEYEFTDTKVECETRPRLKSFKFNLSLGGMYLRDKITPDSVFPLLISPQNVQGAPLYPRSKHLSGNRGGTSGITNIAKSLTNFLPLSSTMGTTIAPEEPLFYLNYEKRPFTNTGGLQIDFRLHLKSQPLNVVYNPTVVQCVSNFFTIPEDLGQLGIENIEKGIERKLAEAKERTKEELKKNFNSLLEGENYRDNKIWDIAFELSAPQILIPEHFIDKDAMIMVVDFGKLHLRNDGNELLTKKLASIEAQARSKSSNINQSSSNLQKYLSGLYPGSKAEEEEIDSDEEEFCTPASSPTTPVQIVSPPTEKVHEILDSVTETSIKRKLYDRYMISLSNMQIIVGRVKDNWKHAHIKGNSHLHILDKFSITLNCERRIVNTNDPNLPNIIIAGTLPKLVVHINEDKVHTIERMTRLLLGDLEDQHSPNQISASCQTDSNYFMGSDGPNDDDTIINEDIGRTDDQNFFSKWEPKSDLDASSKLLLLYFCVTDMSIQLQSQGKSVAELQVTGVKASFTRRPYDTNIAMSVHSLLLVDAIQTFGPNFDLLIASHRQVSVDSVSGSLRGSEPVSPHSPGSPALYQQALKGGFLEDMMAPTEISKALASLQADRRIARELRARGHSPRALSGDDTCNVSSTPIEPLLSEKKPYRGRHSDPLHTSEAKSPSSVFEDQLNPSLGVISPMPVDIQDPHALISVDILIVSPNCPSLHSDNGFQDSTTCSDRVDDQNNEQLQIVSIQFNSLDVIANQETIVELVSFVKRVLPAVNSTHAVHHKRRRIPTKDQSCQTDNSVFNIYGSITSMDSLHNNSSLMFDRYSSMILAEERNAVRPAHTTRIELTADFQRLNILLLRAVTGKMIGTALLTEVKIHSTISENDITASGELGGLQVMNLLTGTKLHQKIFSVGKDPVTEDLNRSEKVPGKADIHAQLYPELINENLHDQSLQALKFDILTHGPSKDGADKYDCTHEEVNEVTSKQIIDVKLRMASVCYLHSASFLEELNSCATDFKGYMSNLANSIRSAATDLALGIVNRRTESIGHANNMDDVYGPAEVYGRNVTPSKQSKSRGIWRSGSFRGKIIHPSPGYECGDQPFSSSKVRAPAPTPRHIPVGSPIDDFRICLDVVMETPIIVVPRHERSFEVLVAHLGYITIKNEFIDDETILQNDPNLPPNSLRLDRASVNINDINVHSLCLSEKIKRHFKKAKLKGKLDNDPLDNMDVLMELEKMKAEQMYSIAAPAIPILHDTAIELSIDRIRKGTSKLPKDESYNSFFMADLDTTMKSDDEKTREADSYQIRAKVINELKISLHRCQYEQVLESLHNISRGTNGNNQRQDKDLNSSGQTRSNKNVHYTASSLTTEQAPSGMKSSEPEISGGFEIPHLTLELRGDMLKIDNVSKEHGQGLVYLKFHEFAVSYRKSEKYKSTVEIALGSLIMEDLLLGNDSPHRKLATSISKERKEAPLFGNLARPGLSSSCPELWYHTTRIDLSTSLPNDLDKEALYGGSHIKSRDTYNNIQPGNVFYGKKKKPQDELFQNEGDIAAPATPPPSVCSSRASPTPTADTKKDLQRDDNLVHIKILNIDRDVPDFVTRHNSTNRFIDINFNTLDIIFNLQTWVIVLDFFGIGSGPSKKSTPMNEAAIHDRKKSGRDPYLVFDVEESKPEIFNTEMEVKVKSLSVLLNKPEYELASVTARNYSSKISLRDNNFAIWGSLGDFSLKDLTSHGLLYKDRISSKRAKQAFNFHFFKFGSLDEKLERPQDATLKIRMSSIIYVHTNRFYSELVAFFNQFQQLHSVTRRMREAAAGSTIKEIASRGSRVTLDIEASSPLLILPMSSFSSQILVIDLGRLEIRNVFRFSGDEGTISAENLATVETSDLLGTRMRGRSGSRSSRSSNRSKSSTATRNTRASSGLNHLNSSERLRVRNNLSIARKGVLSDAGLSTDTEDAETDDKVKSLQKKHERCLLDVLFVSLRSMDIRTAERVSGFASEESLTDNDIHVGSFIVHLQPKQVLKEKCELKLQIERNLDKAFNHRVPDLSIKGGLSRVHATVDLQQYMLIRGLLEYNFGECLDDLQFEVPTNEYTEPSLNTLLSGHVWTGMFMDIELLNVIIDIITSYPNEETCLARVNLIKSRLIYESFSDSSKDVDLVSQEILLDDMRFQDCPMNKRSNVFSQILQPMTKDMLPQGERTSLLQAEVHYRSTQDVNRFTILLNNMRLMGIFDWWTAVLQFISKSTDNPNPPVQKDVKECKKHHINKMEEETKFSGMDEPLYTTAGIVTRRVRTSQTSGPVYELKLNITDSELIIVADPSQSDSSTVILRSTTVISYRPDLPERPFSCNLNNAEVFSCVLSNKEESALSIIDPVTINLEIGSRGYAGNPPKGLIDLADEQMDDFNVGRNVEIQLQQLNIRLSYHDWLMFQRIIESFPRQAREALSNQAEYEKYTLAGAKLPKEGKCIESPPMNIQAQITKLRVLGFGRKDCHRALEVCDGQIDEAAIWLTQNAIPTNDDVGQEFNERECLSKSATHESQSHTDINSSYLEGSKISFSAVELKTSCVNLCIIDDCKDADVPLLEIMLQQLNLKHEFTGNGKASSQITGSYYNRALSSWEPFLEPWRCGLEWKVVPIGASDRSKRYSVTMDASDVVNFNLTSTLIDMYQLTLRNWTEDYYLLHPLAPSTSTNVSTFDSARGDSNDGRESNSIAIPPASFGRRPFVPFALKNETGCKLWFTTQTKMATSQFGPNRQRHMSRSSKLEDDMKWQQLEPDDITPFTFEIRGKMRHLNSHDVKVHQLIVRVHGWQEVSPVSVDRVGTYFRQASPLISSILPPARVVFQVKLEGSARKLVTIRSALIVTNLLPYPIELKLDNSAFERQRSAENVIGDNIEIASLSMKPKAIVPIPLNYVWARIFARPASGGIGQWKYSEKPINWYHIMSSNDNSMDVHASAHGWNSKKEASRFCVSVKRLNYPIESSMTVESSTHNSKDTDAVSSSTWIQPAHLVTFMSPMMIENLLPCHLSYQVKSSSPQENVGINIAPGKQSYLSVDIATQTTICFSLDMFPGHTDLNISPSDSFETQLKFLDNQSRSLNLSVKVECKLGGSIHVTLLSPYWLVNKTGLPLIFKEEGNSADIQEAAGQEDEHEVARMAAPLMFSFDGKDSSIEASNSSLSMRVGKGLHPQGKAQFCYKYPLQPGSTVRRLRVAPEDSRRVDIVYVIGIETRIGKGRYRDTLIVTLSPRFQLHNQSQYKLQIAQSCFATTFQDPEAEATHLQAYSKSTLTFHWPRLDFDNLLRIRMLDIPNLSGSIPASSRTEVLGASNLPLTHWSGAFLIDEVDSFHVMVRHADGSGRGTFVRVEVGFVGATYYTAFFDAANFPPPFRIDNFSEVPITYYQSGVEDVSQLRSVVKPHYSVPYALDEPTLDQQLSLAAPGGTTEVYNMNVIGAGMQLTYENFIYIAMTSTVNEESNDDTAIDPLGNITVTKQPLVLDVEGTRVVLAPKEAGKRSQLWRMTSTGMLVHEGSSPPQDPRTTIQKTFGDGLTTLPPLPNTNVLVLDIAGTAVQPNSYTPLMLRKPDDRRQLTQRWKFTNDGRLACSHRGLYAQAKDGFIGLVAAGRYREPGGWQQWNDVVLGPSLPITHERTANGIPVEQALCRKRLRPGSGFISVSITTDGPTRVLQIADSKCKKGRYARLEEKDWNLINESKRPNLITMDPSDQLVGEYSSANYISRKSSKTLYDCDGKLIPNENEFQLLASFKSGIGLSLVSREPAEELLYLFMSNILVEYQASAQQTVLDGSVQNIQIDNQLFEAQNPIAMFVSPSNKNDEYRHMPAIHFASSKSKNGSTENAEIYKHLMVTVKNVTLNLEEELICKVLKFAGITKSDAEMETIDESAFEAQRALIANTSTATRYYFGTLKLALNQVKLSVSKSDKPLSHDLQTVKKKLGLTLITFEDAHINLEPFIRVHPFETVNFLTNAVVHHYQDELLSQAVQILVSTDFLGNPIGLLHDIREGVSGLVSEGNVGGLIKSVTHGAANSTAKMTGSISYGISKATVHERYDERRLMLRKRRGEKSKEHLLAGLKGLGFGMFGGLTSIASETYIGVANEGVTGFFTGLGWGLVGTITKPAIGILDLATGAATAVKESSKSVYKQLPPKLRPPRLVLGAGGSLPNYTRKSALGQELLHKMNGRNYREIFVAHEQLRFGHEDLQILISTERMIVFSHAKDSTPCINENVSGESGANDLSLARKPSSKQVLTVSHKDLICARVVSHKDDGITHDEVRKIKKSSSHPNIIENEKERHYIELMIRSEGSPNQAEDQQKRPQVRCDNEQIARSVVQDINYARNMHEEMTQAVNEKLESDELCL